MKKNLYIKDKTTGYFKIDKDRITKLLYFKKLKKWETIRII